MVVKEAFKRVGTYNYYLPYQTDCRDIVWMGMDRSGKRFLDYIPPELVARRLDKEMLIEFINGSVLKFSGTENNTLVGRNPIGCVFSEYSRQDPKVWQFIQPILRENGGWAVFESTFYGKHNHFYRMYEGVQHNPDWYVENQNIEYTGVVNPEDILMDIETGQISYNLARQEYWNDVNVPQEGSYFGSYVNQAEEDGRLIENDAYIPNYDVYTCWDLGIRDSMAVWWFQLVPTGEGGEVRMRFIDYYENHGEGMKHYIDVLLHRQAKYGYKYGGHYAPHDIKKRELSTGKSLQYQAEEEGLFFERVPKTNRLMDDIEQMRRVFHRLEFDAGKCRQGIDLVATYHSKKIEKLSTEGRPVFAEKPVHDGFDGVSALRTGIMAWTRGMVRNMGMGEIKVRQFIEFEDSYEGIALEEGKKRDIFAEVMCDEEENEFNIGAESYAI